MRRSTIYLIMAVVLLVTCDGVSTSTDDKILTVADPDSLDRADVIRPKKARFLRKHIMEEDGLDDHESFDEERGNGLGNLASSVKDFFTWAKIRVFLDSLEVQKLKSVNLKHLDGFDADLKRQVKSQFMKDEIRHWTSNGINPLKAAEGLTPTTKFVKEYEEWWKAWAIYAAQYLRWLRKSAK